MKNITLPLRFGIAISGSLIAFFLILSLFNAHTSPAFSFFNSIIIAFGIYEAIKSYKLRQGNKFNYSNGFTIGVLTGFVATIILAIFFTFYITKIDVDFPITLVESFKEFENINSISISNVEAESTTMIVSSINNGMKIIIGSLALLIIIILGFITTIILSLLCMQLINRKIN